MNFLVQQGDHVDLILTVDFASGTIAGSPHLRPNDTEIVRTVKTVLQNKRVLYVSATNIPPPPVVDEEGNEVPQPETVAPGSIIVVFAGTDADAELVTFAQRGAGEVGAVTMTLRKTDDEAAGGHRRRDAGRPVRDLRPGHPDRGRGAHLSRGSGSVA